jgi:hypothetical protein
MAGERNDMEADNTPYITLTAEFEDFEGNDVRREFRFSNPGKAKIQRCQKEMVKSPDKAFRTLVMDCIHPDEREKLSEDIDRYPGLPTTYGNEILRRCGFDSLGK